ncbi:hypothetical protein ACL0VS_14715 [Chryseobacterium sp. PMSZPI]|nr:hypothetical protein CW752_07320 [Chryseobacterium sp. PMSZPI]
MILKINNKTILNALRDLFVNAFVAVLIIALYSFIFDEKPPFILYLSILIFFIILYLYPTLDIFYSYYWHDQNVLIDIDSEGFLYTKGNESKHYYKKDFREIKIYLTAYKKNNENARLAHTKFFYVEIIMLDETKIILTSLLSCDLYDALIKMYEDIPVSFIITQYTKLKKAN